MRHGFDSRILHRNIQKMKGLHKLKLRNKFSAKIAAMTLAVSGLTGVGLVTDTTLGAESANAASVSSCRLLDAGYGYVFYGPSSTGRYASYCYFNYDWFEEAVLGMRDGMKMVNVRSVRCDWMYRVGC